MASPLLTRAPQCMSCIRRMAYSLGDAFRLPAGQQIRGKKKMAKVATVKVHLLVNIPGYGKRGTVIPVTSGMMRNIWYPKKMAEYLTLTKLRELGVKKDSTVERDSAFRSNAERKLEKLQEKEKAEEVPEIVQRPAFEEASEPAPHVELEFFSPEQATSILEDLLPPNLDFYRTVITLPTPKRVSPSLSASSAISAAAAIAEANKASESKVKSIHGSVTTSDIAANLKAILAEDEQGAQVVLSSDDISFVEQTENKDRVKQLGIFEFEIRLDGAPDSVRRTIRVNPQD